MPSRGDPSIGGDRFHVHYWKSGKGLPRLGRLNQWELPTLADLDTNTIRNFEAWNEKIVRGRADALEKIHKAFADAGVIFCTTASNQP